MARFTRIPLDQEMPWYSFTVTLDLASYILEVVFNSRSGIWLMNIYDVAQNPLLMSIPLLVRRDLTRSYHTLNIPKGAFVALDDAGDGSQPGLSSFLLDHTLYYVSP